MRTTTLLAILGLGLFTLPSARADRVIAKVKVSAKAGTNYGTHGFNHAVTELQRSAARIAELYPGATRHELSITHVKDNVPLKNGMNSLVTKVKGEVHIY